MCFCDPPSLLTYANDSFAASLHIEPFGVRAGQQVSIAVINLNSNIPTFVVTEPVIQEATPGLVSLAESIASSQDLADRVAAFVGVDGSGGSPTAPSSANYVWSTSFSLLSCVGLLLMPLIV